MEVLFTYFHKATYVQEREREGERERDRERARQSQGSPFNAITVYIRGHGFGVIDDLIDFEN